VDPLLRLEIAVGVVAGDGQGDALRPGLLPRLVFGDLGLEPLALAPTQVHAQQHLCPVLGLGTAGAGIDADDGMVRVVGTGEHAGELHALHLPGQGRQQFTDLDEGGLVLPFLPQFDQHLQVLELRLGRVPVVDQLGQLGALLQDLLGALVVVPEVRPGNPGLQFADPLTLAVDVKDTSSARRAFPGVAQGPQLLHGTWVDPLCEKWRGIIAGSGLQGKGMAW